MLSLSFSLSLLKCYQGMYTHTHTHMNGCVDATVTQNPFTVPSEQIAVDQNLRDRLRWLIVNCYLMKSAASRRSLIIASHLGRFYAFNLAVEREREEMSSSWWLWTSSKLSQARLFGIFSSPKHIVDNQSMLDHSYTSRNQLRVSVYV